MMEDEIQDLYETPRDLIIAIRDVLLAWDGALILFSRNKVRTGSFFAEMRNIQGTPHAKLEASYNNFPKQTKNALNQKIGQAFNYIKNDLRNVAENDRADALPGLIKTHLKEALAKIEGASGGEMFTAYEMLCNIDAIYDLLTSELHRLDPVIGDLGCQWRAPFVLDLHDAVHDYLGVNYDFSHVQDAITAYENLRAGLPHCTDILKQCEKSGSIQVSKKLPPVYSSKKIKPWYDGIIGFRDALRTNAPAFFDLLEDIETFIGGWLVDEIPGFHALEYIQLCKLLTANRIRTLDEFGLSGIQTDYDVPDAKRTLGDCLVRLTNHSMRYMTYVCEQSCSLAGVALDDDGYATDPTGKIHLVGSALKLLKDARFWTLQKSSFYKTIVCYGPTRAIFTRQAQIGHPIIIDLRRLICTPDNTVEGGFRYTYNGGAILYYEAQNGEFVYVPNDQLTEDQKSKVGMVCEACSMVLVGGTEPEDEDSVFCTQNFDVYLSTIRNNCTIVDLIMYGISSHPELTTQIHETDNASTIWTEDETNDQVLTKYCQATGLNAMPVVQPGTWKLVTNKIPFPDATTPEWDLLTEKANLLSVLPKFNATSSQYKAPVPGDRSQADRNAQTMPFAPIHIYGSTFNRKIAELEEAEQYINNNNVNAGPNLGLQRVGEGQCRPRANQ